MSLAVLARKTKAKQRLNTRGKFILNMTGRGNVLGLNAKMSRGNCKGLTNCAGKRAACCAGTPAPQCCTFKHGGKPAPQMGYGIYLNRKSKGAYHPGGGPQCCTKPNATTGKIVYKQPANIDASVITTRKKDAVLACNSDVLSCPKCSVVDPDLILTTGSDGGGSYNFSGIDTQFTMNIVPGSITPSTINSAPITWIGYQDGGNFNNMFFVALDNGGTPLSQNHFSTISFMNCRDNTMRSYDVRDASYNSNGLPSSDPLLLPPPPIISGAGNTIWIWNLPLTHTGGVGTHPNGWTGTDLGSVDRAWWAAAAGVTSVAPSDVPMVVGSQAALKVYIDQSPSLEEACEKCLGCPVRKNMNCCRATDLVRYTRINHNWCTCTKAVAQNRVASEQIARVRAGVDCIAPKHRNIFITLDRTGTTYMSFDGCCGNQCLISGQRYTFHITIINPGGIDDSNFRIRWCNNVVSRLGSLISGAPTITGIFSVTVPNTSCSGLLPASLTWYIDDTETNHTVTFDYCKQAFKKPQMLGSCNGR